MNNSIEQIHSVSEFISKFGLPILVCSVLIIFGIMFLVKILFPSLKARSDLKIEREKHEYELEIRAKEVEQQNKERMLKLAEEERLAAIRLTTATKETVDAVTHMQKSIAVTQRQILDPVHTLLDQLAVLLRQHSDFREGWQFETVVGKQVGALILEDLIKHGTIQEATLKHCIQIIKEVLGGPEKSLAQG